MANFYSVRQAIGRDEVLDKFVFSEILMFAPLSTLRAVYSLHQTAVDRVQGEFDDGAEFANLFNVKGTKILRVSKEGAFQIDQQGEKS